MTTVGTPRAPNTFSLIQQADDTPITITPGEGQEQGQGPKGGVLGGGGGRPPPIPPPQAPVTVNNGTTITTVAPAAGPAGLRSSTRTIATTKTSTTTTTTTSTTKTMHGSFSSFPPPPPPLSPKNSTPKQQQQQHTPSVCGSFFSEGRDFYDDEYSMKSEDSVQDRLDFSSIQIRSGQDIQNIQILHDVYSHVQHHSNNSSNPKDAATGTIEVSDNHKSNTTPKPPLQQRKRSSVPLRRRSSPKLLEEEEQEENSTSSVVLIKGVSGTGKSTLVKKFIQELNVKSKLRGGSKKPYFLSGKCDELSGGGLGGGDPYSAIVEALNGFATTIVNDESSTELERIRTAISDKVGYETAQALTTIIPNLKHVIVKQQQQQPQTTTTTATATETSSGGTNTKKKKKKKMKKGSQHKDPEGENDDDDDEDEDEDEEIRPIALGSKENAWNRLKYIFQVFTNAISTKERPVIMFLDDLQWCDNASLELLEALLTDPDLQYLMFIGAYRDDELDIISSSSSSPTSAAVVGPVPVPKTGKYQQQQQQQQQQHILQTTMKNIQTNTGQTIPIIHLVNMTYNELYDFVSNVLLPKKKEQNDSNDNVNMNDHHYFNEKEKQLQPLVDVIYRKTSGNIFFTIQVMEELQRKGILLFSRMTFEWEWNLENIETLDEILSDDVLEAVTSKISSAPKLLQQALILAAYTRSTVDIDTLQQLLELENNNNHTMTTSTNTTSQKELLKVLDDAVIDGLLSNSMGSKSYSFAHDRIQQAAYAMVPTGRERDDFRLKMGLRLYELGQKKTTTTTTTTMPGDERSSSSGGGGGGEDWMLFVAADHLNATSYQVRTTLGYMFLTKLNLEVGQRAASVAAYETASKFLNLAIQCLLQGVKDPWMTEYETTLQIYRCIVDVELCQGHFDVGSGMGARIFEHAKTADDKLPTQISLARALGREREHPASFNLSVKALRDIGGFPQGFVGVHLGLAKDLLYVKRYFKKKSNDDILKLPSMTDERLLQTMDLLNTTAYQAFHCGKEIEFLAAILRMLRLTFQHGLCGQSGVGMMGWTLFLDTLNDMEGVSRFSRLARDTLRVTKAKELECLQLFVAAYWISTWRDPHEEVLEVYHRAHKSGMESGDFENGHLSLTASYHHEFLAGYSLSQLDDKYASLMEKLDLYKVDSVKVMTIEQWLVIQHLRGSAEAPLDFGALESFGFEKHDGSENYQVLYGCMARMQLGVYFGNCQFSETFIQKITPLADLDCAHSPNSVRLFFGSLTYATLAREKMRRSYRKKAKKYADELKAICKVKGMNSYHRYLLAEAHRRAGRAKSGNSAQNKYDHAIATALRSGHGQDAALGSQLAAEYFLGMRDEILKDALIAKAREILVRQYLTQARDWYLQWGARGLVHHLEQTYSEYLVPTPESVAEESMDVVSCAETFNSMDLGNSFSSYRTMPKIVSKPHGDDISVMTDQSAWRKASTYTNPHTTDGDFPALLDELDV